MFTIEFWKKELVKFDELFEEHSEDEDQIDRLARGIAYLGARTAHRNPEKKQEIIEQVVERLLTVEDKMGRQWMMTRLVEITAHALPT